MFSIILVSYETRELLRACLRALQAATRRLACELIVVDNNSSDGSAEMVCREFPGVVLIRSSVNLGFAAACNRAFRITQSRDIVLVNPDALPAPDAFERVIDHLTAEPRTGIGGGQLVAKDGSLLPSARRFPSLLRDFLTLSGLAGRFPRSRFFGQADWTWADPTESRAVDWVPGAFFVIRRDVLEAIGHFDESFFLYYEEVDFCRRAKAAGYSVRYWGDVVVTHLGGESAKTVRTGAFSPSRGQLVHCELRSRFIYYRKHHGWLAWLALCLDAGWHWLRLIRNLIGIGEQRRAKVKECLEHLRLARRVWQETAGGRTSRFQGEPVGF